mmetsp:Transcript_30921/g.66844  ORF Transcript_30921/g.66844 Transcript_30921/m.66844 type:complete len:88 (+) Transcript_30921:182-445(+)
MAGRCHLLEEVLSESTGPGPPSSKQHFNAGASAFIPEPHLLAAVAVVSRCLNGVWKAWHMRTGWQRELEDKKGGSKVGRSLLVTARE